MGIAVTPTGRFPIVRAGAHPLRSALEAWRERGDTSAESAQGAPDVAAGQLRATQELVAAQEEAGVDLLGDGYVPAYDEWFAWAPSIDGVTVGSLIRYLDTNTYYHRWCLTGRPRRKGPGPSVAAYRRAAALTTKPIKPCLFGPYTLWAYATSEGEAVSPATFDALIDIWAAEVADLAAAGARHVQLEESIILRPYHRSNAGMVRRAIERIASAAPGVQLFLHLACGAVGDLLEPLLDTPGLSALGLDFTDVYREPNLQALERWRGATMLQAGLADARHIRVETPEELRQTLRAVEAHVPAARCLAAPSTALLYLPRHVAFEKLAALAAVAHDATPVEVLA